MKTHVYFIISILTAISDPGEEDEDKPCVEDLQRGSGHIPQEGEPDFIETNCHWDECSREFDTQEELVRVPKKMLLIKSYIKYLNIYSVWFTILYKNAIAVHIVRIEHFTSNMAY